MGGCCATSTHCADFDPSKQQFLGMIQAQPDLDQFDRAKAQAASAFWKSSIYGGSVFEPVGTTRASERMRWNALRKQLDFWQTDLLYGGGFY